MLPAKNRFSLRKDSTFFDRAQKHFFPFGVVFYVREEKNSDQSKIVQVAPIIPKKYWKKATQRNYLKRLVMSAAWETILKKKEAVERVNLKMALYLSKVPKERSFSVLVKEIEQFLEKQKKQV